MGSTCLLLIVNVYKLLKHYLCILGSRQKKRDKKTVFLSKVKTQILWRPFMPDHPRCLFAKENLRAEQWSWTAGLDRKFREGSNSVCLYIKGAICSRSSIAIIGRVHTWRYNSESSFLWQYLLKLGGKLPLISLLSGNVAPVHCAMLLENRPLEREVAVACVA